MTKKPTKRAKKYEPKLVVADNVEFDDLFKVAIHHNVNKKKAVTPKKKKK